MLTRSISGTAKPPRQRGWWIPYTFVGLFMVVVAVNSLLIYFAASSFTGMHTEKYWLAGSQYNRAIEGAREQAERGWSVQFMAGSSGSLTVDVDVVLRDHYGNLLSGAEVEARVIRPIGENRDVTMPLAYLGQGRYAGAAAVPLPGQWDVRIIARHPAGDYQEVKRIWVRE